MALIYKTNDFTTTVSDNTCASGKIIANPTNQTNLSEVVTRADARVQKMLCALKQPPRIFLDVPAAGSLPCTDISPASSEPFSSGLANENLSSSSSSCSSSSLCSGDLVLVNFGDVGFAGRLYHLRSAIVEMVLGLQGSSCVPENPRLKTPEPESLEEEAEADSAKTADTVHAFLLAMEQSYQTRKRLSDQNLILAATRFNTQVKPDTCVSPGNLVTCHNILTNITTPGTTLYVEDIDWAHSFIWTLSDFLLSLIEPGTSLAGKPGLTKTNLTSGLTDEEKQNLTDKAVFLWSLLDLRVDQKSKKRKSPTNLALGICLDNITDTRH